jgi:uncharacterized membrane protein
MSGVAYLILARVLIAVEGTESLLARAMGRDRKGKLSLVLYASAIPLAFMNRWLAQAIFVLVALIWLAPDRRIEKLFGPGTEADT